MKLQSYLKFSLIPVVLLFSIVMFWYYLQNGSPSDGMTKVEFLVPSGAGSIAITNKLYRSKLIKSRTAFRMMLRLKGKSTSLKKGVYTLDDGMSASQVIAVLTSGQTKTKKVTIPEGYNNRQIGDLLAKKGFFESKKEFLEFAQKPEILQKFNIPAITTEGYLFPETYYIPIGYPKLQIIDMMLSLFFRKVKRIENFPKKIDEIHKKVILASIVEREAKLKEERPLIAGVFANRLTIGQPLESCATIQYLFDKPHKRIYYQDLEIQSPYNTYLHKGMPPGPIASPGYEALNAAVNPEATEYKYFVVKGDGSHTFSKTFREHNRAKNLYLKRR